MTESKLAPLTLDLLRTLVAGDTVAIRGTAKLEPAGGPGDKVFPPTHSVGDRADTRYAFEQRRIDGKEVTCVLLDSVQSQANRMEEALHLLSGRVGVNLLFTGTGPLSIVVTEANGTRLARRSGESPLRFAVRSNGGMLRFVVDGARREHRFVLSLSTSQ